MIGELMIRLGRKMIEVDYFARLVIERWFLFYYEDESLPPSWVARNLPNVFVHRYAGQASPTEDAHSHPWSTLAIILRGGYVEIVNGTPRRTRWLSYLSYRDNHSLAYVEPGTVSLFLHGVRRQPWLFIPTKCDSPCPACRDSNNGVCAKPAAPFSWNEKTALTDDWSVSKWMRVDTKTKRRLDIRRKALIKLGVSPIEDETHKKYMAKKQVIAKQKEVILDKGV